MVHTSISYMVSLYLWYPLPREIIARCYSMIVAKETTTNTYRTI